jgi:hypothetical protein
MRKSGLHTRITLLTVLTLCAAIAAGGASCSLFGKKDKTPMKKVSGPVRPPAFEFKFALEPGASYSSTFLFDEAIQISSQNEDGYFTAPAPVRFDLSMIWKVLEQDKDKTDRFNIDITMEEITLVSENLDPLAAAEVLPRFQNQTMTLVVNKDGEIEDYYALELDSFFTQLEEEFKGDADKLAVVAQVKQQFTWDLMVERFSLAFHFVPPSEESAQDKDSKRKKAGIVLKKKDDTWTAKTLNYMLPGQISVPVEMKYKFADLKKESGVALAEILFGIKQDLSLYSIGEDTIAGVIAKGKRVQEKSGAYETMDFKGYAVYNTTANDIEEIKAEMTATGKITIKPRRGDPVDGQLEIKRNYVLSLAQNQTEESKK